jgi:hypothetical protein
MIQKKYIDQYGIDSLPHLVQAGKTGAEIFVTLNQAMLKDRAELEQLYKIKIRTPGEVIHGKV